MNLMCWTKHIAPDHVNDQPESIAPNLRNLLIQLNDDMCMHTRIHQLAPGEDEAYVLLNCARCSTLLLDWAFALDDSNLVAMLLEPEETEGLHKLLARAEQAAKEMRDLCYMHFDTKHSIDPRYFEADFRKFTLKQAVAEVGEAIGAGNIYCEGNCNSGSYLGPICECQDIEGVIETFKKVKVNGNHRRSYESRFRKVIKAMYALSDYAWELRNKYLTNVQTKEQFTGELPTTLNDYNIQTVNLPA